MAQTNVRRSGGRRVQQKKTNSNRNLIIAAVVGVVVLMVAAGVALSRSGGGNIAGQQQFPFGQVETDLRVGMTWGQKRLHRTERGGNDFSVFQVRAGRGRGRGRVHGSYAAASGMKQACP